MEKSGVVDAAASGRAPITADDLVCALTPEAGDLVELAIFQSPRGTVVVRLDRRRAVLIGRALLDWADGRHHAMPAAVTYEVSGLS